MNTKLIIFDLDGTLYDLNDVIQTNYEMQVKFLCQKKSFSEKEAISFLKENHIYPIMKQDSLSATELFLQIGLSKTEWSEFRNKYFRTEKINISKAVHEDILLEFSKFAKIVLLSSNAYSVIEKILKHISISPLVFDEIVCSDRYPYDTPFNKSTAMRYLSSKYLVSFKSMCSIGDRFSTDIKPMLDLGGTGILVKYPLALNNVLYDMNNNQLSASDIYNYYK